MQAFETSAYLEMIRRKQNLEFQMDKPLVSLAVKRRKSKESGMSWRKRMVELRGRLILGDNHVGEAKLQSLVIGLDSELRTL